MERYFLRGISGTAMNVQFGFGGGPTTVNRMAVTALHCIMNPLLLTFVMFDLIFFLFVV